MKENSEILIIETGTDRAKMKIKKWAIGSVDTIHDDAG
jgi:preprotein translocase subunit YajC